MHSFAPDRTDRYRLIIDTRYQSVGQEKDKFFLKKRQVDERFSKEDASCIAMAKLRQEGDLS